MDPRWLIHLVLTAILAVVIHAGYRSLHADVRLLYEGKDHQAEVVAIEPRETYCYVRLEWTVRGKTYARSLRLKEARPWKHGERIPIRLLEADPEIMSIEFDQRKVYHALWYVFLVAVLLFLYRAIWLLVKSTRPHWD